MKNIKHVFEVQLTVPYSTVVAEDFSIYVQ